MARFSNLSLIFLSSLGVLLADRFSKLMVIEFIDLPTIGRVEIVPPFLNFVMAWNRGVNFGIGAGGPETMRWILAALAVAISIGLGWWAMRRNKRSISIAAGVVIGGALGNAWDRVQYGAVADFLNMSCCGVENPYAFNIADSAIFLGAVTIAIKA